MKDERAVEPAPLAVPSPAPLMEDEECDKLRLKLLNRTETAKESGSLRKAFLKMSGG